MLGFSTSRANRRPSVARLPPVLFDVTQGPQTLERFAFDSDTARLALVGWGQGAAVSEKPCPELGRAGGVAREEVLLFLRVLREVEELLGLQAADRLADGHLHLVVQEPLGEVHSLDDELV